MTTTTQTAIAIVDIAASRAALAEATLAMTPHERDHQIAGIYQRELTYGRADAGVQRYLAKMGCLRLASGS